jgi:hypothetical protein
MKVYVRIPRGTGKKPYTYELRSGGSVIATRTSSNEEEVFDTTVTSYSYKVTDADGKIVSQDIDTATINVMKRYWKVYSTTYGNAEELVRHVRKAKQIVNGTFNVAGTPFTSWDYFQEQSDFDNPVWSQRFDHTENRGADPALSTFAHPFDKVIYTAYKSGNSFETRTGLKIGFNFGRMGKYNNNNTYSYALKEQGYNFTFPMSDIQRRPDGKPHDGDILYYGFPYVGSFASDDVLNYGKEILAKFCYRYQPAINDGTIHGINFFLDSSGEAQYPFDYRDFVNGEVAFIGRGLGDFSDVMRRKFMEFCRANFTTGTDASTTRLNQKYATNIPAYELQHFNVNLLTNGSVEFRKLFYWFQMEMLSQYETTMQEYAYQKAGLTRSKLWILDVGSIFDPLLTYRKTLNVNRRLSKSSRWIGVKGNNDIQDLPWVTDQITSAAKACGGIPIYEPSPPTDTVPTQFTVENITPVVNYMKTRGIHLSAFLPSNGEALWTQVVYNTGLDQVNTTSKLDDLDGNGIPITAVVKFKEAVFDEFTTGNPLTTIRNTYNTVRSANPGKSINIHIDDSDVLADLKTQ